MAEIDAITFAIWIAASLRSATPLLLVMLGETLTQRTGVINLGVEGEMLMGACIGFAVAAATGSPLVGLAAGAVAGLALSTVHAALVLGAQANQIGSGLAVWILGLGLTSYYGRAFVGGKVEAVRWAPISPPRLPSCGRSSIRSPRRHRWRFCSRCWAATPRSGAWSACHSRGRPSSRWHWAAPSPALPESAKRQRSKGACNRAFRSATD